MTLQVWLLMQLVLKKGTLTDWATNSKSSSTGKRKLNKNLVSKMKLKQMISLILKMKKYLERLKTLTLIKLIKNRRFPYWKSKLSYFLFLIIKSRTKSKFRTNKKFKFKMRNRLKLFRKIYFNFHKIKSKIMKAVDKQFPNHPHQKICNKGSWIKVKRRKLYNNKMRNKDKRK